MAVRMMKSFKNEAEALAACEAGRDIEIVRDYRGHEEGVRHGRDCAHHGVARAGTDKAFTAECIKTRWTREEGDILVNALTGEDMGKAPANADSCCLMSALYMETTLVGKVLSTGERNGRDDSDFTVTYWDGTGPSTMTYASTRGWTYPNNAVVDADAETKAAYAAWCEARNVEAAARRAVENERLAKLKAEEPAKGKRALVFKGRKVPVGTEGVIIWLGDGNYGPRVGIKDDEGTVHWTAATNVRRIVEDKADDETFIEYAERKAEEAYEDRKAAEEAAPEIGATVRVLRGEAEGVEGTVFWARNGRLGIARAGAKKKGRGYADEDVVWTFGDAVETC